MTEYYVVEKRDTRIGDTWYATGVFGLSIGGSLVPPSSCPICGATATTCKGDAGHGSSEEQASEGNYSEAA